MRESRYEGFVFAYEVTHDRFVLKLFRALPLASVLLKDIVCVRQRSGDDVRELLGDGIRRPFRNIYWPHPILAPDRGATTAYVVCTRSDRHIFVRLGPEFHYRLREGVGRVRAEIAHADRAARLASQP